MTGQLLLPILLSLSFLCRSLAIESLTARYVLNEKDILGLSDSTDGVKRSYNEDPLEDIQELYIEQPLDHFKSSLSMEHSEVTTLQQRYFYTDRFVTPPVSTSTLTSYGFLCVGGEGPSLTKHVLLDSVHCTGDMLELAKQLFEDGHPVYLFALEHRYYGESYPDFINPVSNKNLTYLSSRQALADLSHFVSKMNEQVISSADVKWVTFGGSYPGMLAAWARLKFPHLIHASVSNSSPVQAQLDFPEYYDHVSFALSDEVVGGSEACLEVVSGGHAEVAAILNTIDSTMVDEENLEKVAELFSVCDGEDGLRDKLDRNVFLGDGLISLDVQGNDPSCTEKLCNIEKVCKNLLDKDESMSNMERLAELFHEQHPNLKCLDTSWDNLVRFLSSPFAKRGGYRSWLWQTCTEFGFYQTCELGSECPFGKGFHVLDQDLEICEKAFGVSKEDVAANVQASLDYYGGWDLKSSRIIFTNGDVDPWSTLAVTGKHGSVTQPALMAEGASHHFWTHKVKSSDSENVKFVRQIIYYQIKEWLSVDDEFSLAMA